MKTIKGNISILGDEDGVEIEVRDKDAAVSVCKVFLTPEQFCQAALGRLVRLECDVQIPPPGRVGMVREARDYEFKMPDKGEWQNRFGTTLQEEVASKFIEANCPDGWKPSLYFGSKDSFFWKDGELGARATLMRWKDRDEQ